MVYDEVLAGRLRRSLSGREGLSEKEMFGGISFLLGGKMCVGVVEEDLVVRVGPRRYEEALGEPHARPMDFTGRSLRGFVFVGPRGYETDDDLAKWVGMALDTVESLLEEGQD